MIVSRLTMTGGASLAGLWAHKRLEDKKQRRQDNGSEQTAGQSWWQAPWQTVQKTLQSGIKRFTQRDTLAAAPPVADEPAPALTTDRHDPNAAIHYGLRASALALGVTTTAHLFFPPLQIAGLPLLVYMGIPPAQAAYEQLWVDGRPSRALTETVALAVCLTGGYYWVGAFGFWLYYGGQDWLAAQRPSEAAQHQDTWAPTARPSSLEATTHRWQDGATCVVSTATLQPGDQVLLHSGELSPVDGVITEGVAWLRPQAVSSTACGLRKAVGDRVTVADIVLVGRICVRVLPTA